ncbi:MAG TPA: ketoacyl-ACP synthase III [Candidatus Limosilactobacillus faecipullorum]|nr:ketoacyl-ACP synthase III [Candidatus Limosilactobacillus faecipullorum]
MKRNLKIVTSGQAVPKHVVTNQDLTAWLDTSNEWITSRTGIKARHLSDGENTADLATRAAKQALERAKWDPTSLDLIIVATMTPEALMPSTAATVQGRLGATKAAAFDLSAACTGFVDALTVANQMLQSPQFQRILVIGAETMSKILDWQDRTTAVLFGDGAGAVLVEASDEPVGFLGFDLMTDGQQGSRLTAGQTSVTKKAPRPLTGLTPLQMDGRAVYKFATHEVPASINRALAQAKVPVTAVDHFLLHQANSRIIRQVAKRLGQPLAKFSQNIDRVGNTAAASEPLLLNEVIENGQLKRGETIVLSGFGGGLTAATIILKY